MVQRTHVDSTDEHYVEVEYQISLLEYWTDGLYYCRSFVSVYYI